MRGSAAIRKALLKALQSSQGDASQWRNVLGVHPWINSPSRAEFVIMASARNPGGGFLYSADEIANHTKYSPRTISEYTSAVRKLGLPLPDRRRGPAGPATQMGGDKFAQFVELRHSGLSNKDAAAQLGISPRSASVMLSPSYLSRKKDLPTLLANRIAGLPKYQKMLPFVLGGGAGAYAASQSPYAFGGL